MLKLMIPMVALAMFNRCEGANFGSNDSKSQQSPATRGVSNQTQEPSPIPSSTPDASFPSPTTGPTTPSIPPSDRTPEKASIGDPAKCWLAVSGTFFGVGVLTGTAGPAVTFPLTDSGRPIKTGERFDAASGGVFLNAREEPYEYQKGDREIDGAIKTSFDSIAVSPGVSIELRNGAGNVVYKGEGPYMAVSRTPPSSGFVSWLISRKSHMPTWMVNYLSPRGFMPEVLNGLSGGVSDSEFTKGVTWVKVTKIANKSCE